MSLEEGISNFLEKDVNIKLQCTLCTSTNYWTFYLDVNDISDNFLFHNKNEKLECKRCIACGTIRISKDDLWEKRWASTFEGVLPCYLR
jgi:hypothetical protein